MSLLNKYGLNLNSLPGLEESHPKDCVDTCCERPPGGTYFERAAARKRLKEKRKMSSKADSKKKPAESYLPKLVVFDLDNTVWTPELYELYKMPVPNKDIKLFPAALKALKELRSQKQWEGVRIGLASRTDEVQWAHNLLGMFKVTKDATIEETVDFKQIYPGCKLKHFKHLKEDSKIKYHDMIFFDDGMYNLNDVSKLGVFCVHCPYGLSDKIWKEGIDKFVECRSKGNLKGVTVGGSRFYDD